MDPVIVLSDSEDSVRDKDDSFDRRLSQSSPEKRPATNYQSSNSEDDDDEPRPKKTRTKRKKLDEAELERQRQVKLDKELERARKEEQKRAEKEAKLQEKARKQEEKERRLQAKTKDKAVKESMKKNLRNNNPSECLKFVDVVIDRSLETFAFYPEVLTRLRDSEIKYKLEEQLFPSTVTWIRNVEKNYVDEENRVQSASTSERQDQMLIVMMAEEVARQIKGKSFTRNIVDVHDNLPSMRLTLVVYGIKKYFRESGRNNRNNENDNGERNLPRISRMEFESSMCEVQVTAKCTSRIVESPDEIALLVFQYTKAIAELPYKRDKREKLVEKLEWFAIGDNKDTVKVDKDGFGLKRLWRQQLCQFNHSSLETAEAICSVYGSPLELFQAYLGCSVEEGENLLKDIPIRRAAGPLTTVRKIGPEFSKKVYTLFTSTNGEAMLGNE